MATDNVVPAQPFAPRKLWFGLAASAFAWLALGASDILITWRACVHEEQFGGASVHPAMRLLYIAVSLLLLAVVISAGAMSYRNWRALSDRSTLLDAEGTDRQEFMALLGVFISVKLGMGVVWLSLPPLLIELCARTR